MADDIVLLSANPFGDYAICAAELLARRGIRIRATYVRKLANMGRLLQEARSEGPVAFTRKVARKLVFRNAGGGKPEPSSLASLKQNEAIACSSLAEFARKHDAELTFCDTFDDAPVCEGIRTFKPKAVVFTGGGTLRTPVLEAIERRIIACHPRWLPNYLGMNCLEWPVLEKRADWIGLSVFPADEGVDTGQILRVELIDLPSGIQSFHGSRKGLEAPICCLLVESAADYLAGDIAPIVQEPAQGRQYFTMHNDIKLAAERQLRIMAR